MKDGAVLCNTGHFNVEIDIPALRELAGAERAGRARSWRSSSWRTAGASTCSRDGRLVNLSAAEGHPASVMDMSFANQALSAEYVVANAEELEPRVYDVPGGDRSRDRPAQAGDAWASRSTAHRGAGAVPGVLGRRDLAASRRGDRPAGGRPCRRPRPAPSPRRGGRAGVPSAAEVAEAIRSWPSAARRRSGSRRPTATRSRRARGEDLDGAAATCSLASGPPR